MNAEQILDVARFAIETRPASASGRWILAWHDHHFECFDAQEKIAKELVVCKFSAEDAMKGFTVKEWARIGQAMYRVFLRFGS